MRRSLLLLSLAALGLSAVVDASAQEPRSVIAGDTIQIGDVVPVAVRLTVEPGARVVWPDTLPLTGEMVENAARVRERVDTLADGRLAVTGVYGVTPWRTGELPLPDLAVRVVEEDESTRTVTASLPAMEVVSVLPADTAGVEPKPAKGVIGPSWSLWPFLLALLLLAAVIAALVWWRRRGAEDAAVPLEPPLRPRERALARLQQALDDGLIEQGAMKELYSRVSDAVREYAATLESTWGEDLTTTELLARFRAQVGPEQARALGQVLRPADQVKFARRVPDAEAARSEWESARAWVLEFRWPPHAGGGREEAA